MKTVQILALSLTYIASSAICISAQAASTVQAESAIRSYVAEIEFQSSAGKTKYETLKEAFDASPTAASPSDLPSYKDMIAAKKPNCVYTSARTPETLSSHYARSAHLITPATPSRGPLFPGKPAVYKGIIIANGDKAKVSYSQPALALFDYIETERETISTLTLKAQFAQARLKNQITDPYNPNVRVRLRKYSDGVVTFIEETQEIDFGEDTPRGPWKENVIGYCFPTDNPMPSIARP